MSDRPAIRKIVPSLVWYTPFEPFGFAIIRFFTGVLIAVHGCHRLAYPASASDAGLFLSPPVAGGFEIAAGALIALGLFTRPIALLLTIEWTAITLGVPLRPGTSWFFLGATEHFPFMVAAFCFAFLMRGGGAWSADRLIGKEV